jgi:pimeloyl-ACP methyl ester carboxylesterase
MVTVLVDDIGPVPVTFTERGDGHTYLLLHGGAGAQSVTEFADLLADAEHAKVITPTHPGFGGTSRPDTLSTVRGLAATYVALLDELDAHDVTVIGNSIGGWIAAEMAAVGSPRIGDVVIVDGVGIEVPGHPVADFFSLTLAEVAARSYHDPDRFRIDPSTMTEQQQAVMAGNRAALMAYAGTAMADPSLPARLAEIAVPTLVVWGDSDQIADADYGRAFAAAIPGARFQLLPDTGHVPQVETPDQLLRAISEFTTIRK